LGSKLDSQSIQDAEHSKVLQLAAKLVPLALVARSKFLSLSVSGVLFEAFKKFVCSATPPATILTFQIRN
jgi:hypothetical protein